MAVWLVTLFAGGVAAQDIYPTPFFTSFADTMIASTYNGTLLAAGSVVKAYDPSGTYCGVNTVRYGAGSGENIFGYFAVYGDDPNTAGLDEGATSGEQISFKINGRDATVAQGDDTWTDQSLKSVTLEATALIAISGISSPNDTLISPGDTATFAVQVQNDGDGLDFYGVSLDMSVVGGPTNFDWEALEPDTVVYADPGGIATVLFSVRAPVFNTDTAVVVSFSVFSHLDPSVTFDGTVELSMSLTDVDDPFVLLPGSFVLEQNYPNPFNPTTTIAWELLTASSVQLDVVDILGRTVFSRDLGRQSTGPGRIEFDASGLPSGVYLYRLATESGSQSRKMVLLK
jgi:hypothetical protein